MGLSLREEPIISRLDRLDNMLRKLEEIKGSPRSSCASSGTITSTDGNRSSVDWKHCRPIELVMMETEMKGTLVERVEQVEERLLKIEKELVRKKQEMKQGRKKKGLKQLVKQCVKGGVVK